MNEFNGHGINNDNWTKLDKHLRVESDLVWHQFDRDRAEIRKLKRNQKTLLIPLSILLVLQIATLLIGIFGGA